MQCIFVKTYSQTCGGRCSGLMFSVLTSGSSSVGSSAGEGHCVVFLGKTLNFPTAFHHPGI